MGGLHGEFMQNLINVFPDVLRIETVGKCNFECIHCPTGTKPNNRGLLSVNNFHFIVEQLTTNGIIPRVVVLYHAGEPLLNKKLPYFIRELKKIGVENTVITTNASLLDEKRSIELIEAGLDEIEVSFDGQNASENNYIREKGDFYHDAENLRVFCKLRKELGKSNPKITVSNVQICTKETLESNRNGSVRPISNVPEYLTEFFNDELDEIEFKSFPAMVWPGYEKLGYYDVIYYDEAKPKYCTSLFETTTILSNGNVVMCCYDLPGELVLGNVFKNTILEIWNSIKCSTIRDNFRKQQYGTVCEKCNVVSPRYLCKK